MTHRLKLSRSARCHRDFLKARGKIIKAWKIVILYLNARGRRPGASPIVNAGNRQRRGFPRDRDDPKKLTGGADGTDSRRDFGRRARKDWRHAHIRPHWRLAQSARRRRPPQQNRMDRRPPRGRGGARGRGPGEAHRPAGVCCGTTGPGSTHLVAGLYEASRDHAPVLALSGDMPRKLQGIDYFQTTDPDLLFRDVSLYTETVSSPAQAPAVIHQAIAAAYAGRGVAHLTLPVDVISAKAEGSVSSLATLKPRSESRRERSRYCRDRPPHRPSRQHRDHVRRRMSWRGRRIARALRSAQGAVDPFRQGQGHHALRRSALDGRHRHDRNEGGSITPSCIAICF